MVYEIEYSKRRKTVGILVERDRRVIVKAPEGFPASRIQEIVEKKKIGLKKRSIIPINILLSQARRNLFQAKV